MYTLMNKNTPLVDFHWEVKGVRTVVVIDEIYSQPWFISSLTKWLERRSVTKNREHMLTVVRKLGLDSTESIIRFSKGVALTDTLWVNQNDKYLWEQVNLFRSEFDKTLECMAFDGREYELGQVGISPEFGTDGTYAKCWHRESDGIYLYKQGSNGAANSGYEVYSEMYASDILEQLGFIHAEYTVREYRGELVSRCKLFTSEQEMLVPLGDVVEYEVGGLCRGFADIIRLCKRNGWIKQLAEYLIADALILNEDRHLGNIGVICDADTFEPKRLAPIYDNGVSLCCFYRDWLESVSLAEYAETRRPALYQDFIKTTQEVASPEQLERLRGLRVFRFKVDSEYTLEEKRVQQLERLVQEQVKKITDNWGYEQRTSAFGELE